jgi:hypothetical protein
MIGVVKSVFWLALVVWLGEIVFFSFVVAPSVFGALPSETAGQWWRDLPAPTLGRRGAIALAAAVPVGGAAPAWSPCA